MSYFLSPWEMMSIPKVPSEVCEHCGNTEDTHSTPFFCDSRKKEALEEWFGKADEVLESSTSPPSGD